MKIQLKGNTVGCISLKDGLVDITDPCYNKDVWCRMNGVKVSPGEWLCTAFSGKDKCFGKRVWVCQIFSSDPKHFRLRSLANMYRDGWKEIGTIGVDAGLAGFFASKPDFNDTEWEDLCDWMHDKDVMCTSVLNSFNKCPVPVEGFWTSSGVGDGCYPVLAYRDEEGTIVGLEIRFL